MNILIAFLIVLAIAVALGVLLLLFSHFFMVEGNPLAKKVRECLPGINCGACGYKGCDDYAAAVADGLAKPNLCIPGSTGVANEISSIMGVEAEEFEHKVAYTACNGHCNATDHIAEYDGIPTCQAASMLYGGPNSCRFGCLGFGDCAAACPTGAICMSNGIARIDASHCIGCGLCSRTCPKGIISMIPQHTKTILFCSNTQKGADARKACENACIGCRKCTKVCPNDAIAVENNLARIDYTKCTNCGACVKECPTGCLKTVLFPERAEDTQIQ